MEKRDMELQALQNLQAAMRQCQEIETLITQQKKKIEEIKDKCEKNSSIKKPILDDSSSSRILDEKWRLEKSSNYDRSIQEFFVCLAVAVLGVIYGPGILGKILAVVAAACCFIGFFTGIVGGIITAVLAVWMGWGSWSNAAFLWQIILLGLGVLHVVFTVIHTRGYNLQQKKVNDLEYEFRKTKQEEQKKHEQALKEYEAALAADVQKRLEEERESVDAIKAQIVKLELLKELTNKSIADNSILAAEDKQPELIRYVIEKLQRKRAESLSEALRQYDEDQRKIRDIMFKSNMELLAQRQKAQQDWEESMQRREHEWKMENEQRRQADELERIRKSLETT